MIHSCQWFYIPESELKTVTYKYKREGSLTDPEINTQPTAEPRILKYDVGSLYNVSEV